MELYNIIGYAGVLVSSISLLPQICQIIKTKQVRDINRYYFFLMIISEALYIAYGAVKYDYVMIASTIPPIISQLLVIYLHCKYKNEEENNVT